MIGVTAAIRRIIASNVPVFCIDTCSLLDLSRDPTRPKFEKRHVEAALHLIARAEARPATLTIVLAQQVVEEVNANLSNVMAEGERAIDRVNKALEICYAYGVLSSSVPIMTASAFTTAAENVIQRFLRKAIVVQGSTASLKRAWDRVANARAPATRGKQSMKDCVIIENYLQLIVASRTRGLATRAMFLSSNTDDYADKHSSRLHIDLVNDFQNAALDFATDFEQARFSI
jgi:hypothetical protein